MICQFKLKAWQTSTLALLVSALIEERSHRTERERKRCRRVTAGKNCCLARCCWDRCREASPPRYCILCRTTSAFAAYITAPSLRLACHSSEASQ